MNKSPEQYFQDQNFSTDAPEVSTSGEFTEPELAFMEKRLIQEFWRVYEELAVRHVPQSGDMPLAVRAFLRHGAIGFSKWWMKPEVREHILADCGEDVLRSLVVGRAVTNIVYADEYLAAVMNWEITPAMDENLEIN